MSWPPIATGRGRHAPAAEQEPALRDLINPAEPAFPDITSVLLKLQELGFPLDEPNVRRAVDVGRGQHADRIETELNRQSATQQRRTATLQADQPSVVYYMRVGNRVKIGFTTDLPKRVENLSPEEVLAVEPGGRLLENVRHRQFAELRTTREWFRYEGRLAEHIAKLRQAAA